MLPQVPPPPRPLLAAERGPSSWSQTEIAASCARLFSVVAPLQTDTSWGVSVENPPRCGPSAGVGAFFGGPDGEGCKWWPFYKLQQGEEQEEKGRGVL